MKVPGPGDIELLGAGRFLRLVRRGGWEFAERINATAVVGVAAVTEGGRLLLVEQFRPPIGANVIELPAGLAGDTAGAEGETLEVAAGRELFEETGYRAGALRLLAAGPSSSGLASEVLHLFWAEQLVRQGAGGGHGDERLAVHEIPVPEVPGWLQRRAAEGVLADFKVFAALWWAGEAAARLHPNNT